MDQHVVAGFYAARDQPGGERADTIVEFAKTPFACRGVERRPDQERMIAAGFRAHPQQPWYIEAREGADNARRL